MRVLFLVAAAGAGWCVAAAPATAGSVPDAPVFGVSTYAPPSGAVSADSVNVSLVLLAGPGFNHTQYESTVEAMQKSCASGIALWVGVASPPADAAHATFNTPDDVAAAVDFSRSQLHSLPGLPMPAATTNLLGAHSPAVSNVLQNFTVQVTNSAGNASNVHGLVFLGGYPSRAHRDELADPEKGTPTLSLAGTLDGVSRFSRNGAEAFFHAQQPSTVAEISSNAVVVAIEGANHVQFADGHASPAVSKLDLVPFADANDVRAAVGNSVADFIATLPSLGRLLRSAVTTTATKNIRSAMRGTQALVQPVLEALRLEGSPYLHESCDSDFPTNSNCNYPQYPDASLVPTPIPKPSPMPGPNCTCGSEWVMQQAQAMMAEFRSANTARNSQIMADVPAVVTNDAFHDVSDVHPFHLPHIWNSCGEPTSDCTLNVTTVTMPIYETDPPDVARAPLGATELRTKLKSRQAMMEAAGFPDQNYNITDGGNLTICKSINERVAAVVWDLLGNATQSHFLKYGEPLQMLDDKVSPIGIEGPEWIPDALNYTRFHSAENETFIGIQSWTFGITNIDHGKAPYYVTAGYHYCKLLSPAWVVDWYFTDGLRYRSSLGNTTTSQL